MTKTNNRNGISFRKQGKCVFKHGADEIAAKEILLTLLVPFAADICGLPPVVVEEDILNAYFLEPQRRARLTGF